MALITRLARSARLAVASRRERRVPFLSANTIERFQRRRLRRIVRHAWETVPYWRAAFEEHRIRPDDIASTSDLSRLPLLDEATIRLRLPEFRSSRWTDADTMVLRSSGSAHGSVRKQIHWDLHSSLMKLIWAERDRAVAMRLAGKEWGHRQLWVLPEATASLATRAWWDRRVFLPRGFVERHQISPERPLEEIAEKLAATRPTIVYSYGSMAERFFRWIESSVSSPPLPRVWIYGGDEMDPGWRDRAERRCRMLSTYQSVEAGRIGWECERRQGFHLNVDLCPVRIVDEAGRDLPPGQVGEVVVSNLVNEATVLFNARLGDRAALSPTPCPCGRSLPLLTRLGGRVSETIHLGNGRVIVSTDLKTLLHEELMFALQVQVVQPAPGRLVWRVVPLPGADVGAATRHLLEESRARLGRETAVAIDVVDEIPLGPGGKARNVAR